MKYVLAISGGVDSVVLLNKIARDQAFRAEHFADALWPNDFLVAHFDHGIRNDSKDDAEFVSSLAKSYGVQFRLGAAQLGASSNEATAREKRYEFLNNISLQNQNAKIVTAHHQDDLLETIVMNLIRGTGWRGLAPMYSETARPMINMNKAEIISYAIDHNLEWHEDSTNDSPRYFRNRIRDRLTTANSTMKVEMLKLYTAQYEIKKQVDQELAGIISYHANKYSQKTVIDRYFLIMIPDSVAIELLHALTEGKLLKSQLKTVLLFAKTAKSGKKLMFLHVKISAALYQIEIENKI